MAISPELVGRTYPAIELYTVSREAVRAFAAAVFAQDPAHTDPEAGIDFSRVVHADQRFTHARPIVVGDELVAATTVDAVRAVGTGAMVTFRTEITDRQGQPVSTARSSLLVRGDDQ